MTLPSRTALPRSTPEAEGVGSAAIVALIDAAEQASVDPHSLMIVRHGRVVAEGWWAPYAFDRRHMLFSLTKSFTSTACGLAVSEGRLSVDDPVLSFFPEFTPETISPYLAAMRVRHLLTMTSGHAEDPGGWMHEHNERQWTKGFLAYPVEFEPGTHFVYNSSASNVIAAILQKLTGTLLVDYLRPRLFEPLGIQDPVWELTPEGTNTGGWGLSLLTEDIAKFGQLYLQRGQWEGRQVVPADWVAEATRRQVPNGTDPNSDWAQGYGYQFWRCRHDVYRGDGAFGQYCIVMPHLDTVVAMTGANANMQAALDCVWQHLLPALATDPCPEDRASQAKLAARLDRLAIPAPAGAASSPLAPALSGREYAFEPNEANFRSATLDFQANATIFTIRDDRGEHRLVAGVQRWIEGDMDLDAEGSRRVAALGAWPAADTYTAKLCLYETPFCPALTLRFAGDSFAWDFRPNVAFGPAERPQLVARAVSAA
jgi:CubicO group peptidase (beta-lactamase class C family)